MKKILEFLLLLSLPLWSGHIIDLDFSGLASLSDMGKKLGKLSFKKQIPAFYRDSSNQKFNLKEAHKYCDDLSVDGFTVWYLPTFKDLLTLSTNTPIVRDNNISVYIKKEYLKLLPKVKDAEELTFWTSNLTIENGYELGEIVAFAYSFDELEESPLDLSSDKRDKRFVICKKSDDVINIRWGSGKFLSIYDNNFRLSPKLRFIGSFDLEDKEPKVIDCKNSEAYFPLKSFLMVADEGKVLYILDLDKRKEVGKIKIPKDKILYLKRVQKKARR